ncbi:MAG: carboxypeptidase M32 [Bacteroidia bacterium]
MSYNYQLYHEKLKKISDIIYAANVLQWDQETYMPPKGATLRAQQLATLAGIAHQYFTDEKLGSLLSELLNDTRLSEKELKNVKQTHKDYHKQKKYSTDFVEELSRTVSETFQAWQLAKNNNDFKSYAPYLDKLLNLKKKECEILGFDEHPYDALLDQYEPGAKSADIKNLFNDVKNNLVDFVKQIAQKPQNDDAFMYADYDEQKQWDFSLYLLKQMGYDFEAGRQDKSTHPFTTHFNALDVRVTTRVNKNDLSEIIWSTIHEGGHALYEQGLPISEYGLPSGEYISLGIHESQSRLWENNVGRSLAYWEYNFPKLQEIFPQNLGEISVFDFYKAMNIVKPSLIRTGADELTYHFHVLIRFETEMALFEGNLAVKDLPEYWNFKYKEYLGIEVPNDTKGVLQDVHWSHGSFGYFPTYSLGSFYAAQFMHTANQQISNLEEIIKAGNLLPLLEWLRNNIHQYGKQYTAEEICYKITGEKLNFKYFMNYAKKKYSLIYNL